MNSKITELETSLYRHKNPTTEFDISNRYKLNEYYILNDDMIYKLQYESKHELYTGGLSLLNISRFSGCPHVYGKYYAKDGNVYSIMHFITKEFLEEGKKSGGDWVKRNRKSEQVDWVFMQCAGDAIQAGFTESQMATIEFIPLTEKILEVNGFFWNENEKIHVLGNPSKYFVIDNNLDTSIGIGCIIKINYVHELQHALRLCGLNELADNFKIE